MARRSGMCPSCREITPVIVRPRRSSMPYWLLTGVFLLVFWPAALITLILAIDAATKPPEEWCAQCGGSMIWRPVWAQIVVSTCFLIGLAFVISIVPR